MDLSAPLVSVVMPAYNAERFISDAIDSVLAQTMCDFELIIVDDGSSDGTLSLAQAAARSDSRIRIIQNETNLGAAGSRNRAFELAKGKYAALLDSDDLWKPEKLALQVALAEETGADIVYCSYEMLDENGEKHWSDFIVPAQTDLEHTLTSSAISCSTALLSERVYKNHAFPVDTYHEDYAYWLTLLGAGCLARGIPAVLASYRVRANSRSFNKFHSAAERWHVYRKYLGLPLGRSLGAIAKYALAGLKKYRKT